MLQAGQEQVQRWRMLAWSRNRKKAGGAGLKGRLVGGETGGEKSHLVMQSPKDRTQEFRFYCDRQLRCVIKQEKATFDYPPREWDGVGESGSQLIHKELYLSSRAA